jgi:uncharacterized Tic20 family protein
MDQKDLLGSEEQVTYGTPTQDEKTMALLAHILTFVAGFIAPLVIYLVKRDESKFVSDHAKESLNFQISLCIYFFISFLLIFVLVGILLMIALGFFTLVLVIVACIKASEGKIYRYPFTIRFLS